MRTKGDWTAYKDKCDPSNDNYYVELRHVKGAKVYEEIGWIYHKEDARFIVTCANQCQLVNPDNPQAVAERIQKLVGWLYYLLPILQNDYPTTLSDLSDFLKEIERK